MVKKSKCEVLRILRIAEGWTISELAQKSGLSQSSISEVENGKHDPSLKMLEKYSITTKIKTSKILEFADNYNGNYQDTLKEILRYLIYEIHGHEKE